MKLINTTQKNHTLWATICRKEAKNAINFQVMEDLETLLDQVESNKEIRAFVLSCEGIHFISGGDLKEFHALETAEEAKPMAKRMLSILQRVEKLPCWTIACINGDAYGGGCETMLAFDFRIASDKAHFGFTQGKFYLPPGWGGLTRLVEKVGRSTALRWLAEAAVIDAREALRYNLIDQKSPDEVLTQKIWEWTRKITKNDRAYIKTLKQGAMRLTKARWEAIEAELEPFSKFWEDERHAQRVQKFLDRKR